MCRYEDELSRTEQGSIILSCCGNSIRLQFGNIVAVQSYEALLDFFDNVTECYKSVRHQEESDIRDIYFNTRLDCLVLNFSPREIAELFTLLQRAIIEYEINV